MDEEEEVSSSVEDGEDSVEETELETAAAEEVKGTGGEALRGRTHIIKKLEYSSTSKNSNDLENIIAGGKYCPPAGDGFIKNLQEKTGKRGRRGTKPHETDTPAKKKALLSGDPRELKKVIDHQDPTGYFRRAFGNYLNSEHFDDDDEEKSGATAALSSLRHDRSQNLNIRMKSKRSTHEHGLIMEGSSSSINGKKKKTMDSDFAENQIIKKMDDHTHDDSHTEHETSYDDEDDDEFPYFLSGSN